MATMMIMVMVAEMVMIVMMMMVMVVIHYWRLSVPATSLFYLDRPVLCPASSWGMVRIGSSTLPCCVIYDLYIFNK